MPVLCPCRCNFMSQPHSPSQAALFIFCSLAPTPRFSSSIHLTLRQSCSHTAHNTQHTAPRYARRLYAWSPHVHASINCSPSRCIDSQRQAPFCYGCGPFQHPKLLELAYFCEPTPHSRTMQQNNAPITPQLLEYTKRSRIPSTKRRTPPSFI